MLLIIAILLVLLLVLLTVPISVAFRLDRIKEINGHVIFYWLFGLVRFRIGVPGAVKAVSRHNKKPREKTKTVMAQRRGWPRRKATIAGVNNNNVKANE